MKYYFQKRCDICNNTQSRKEIDEEIFDILCRNSELDQEYNIEVQEAYLNDTFTCSNC